MTTLNEPQKQRNELASAITIAQLVEAREIATRLFSPNHQSLLDSAVIGIAQIIATNYASIIEANKG